MKQKKIRTDILVLIICGVWGIIAFTFRGIVFSEVLTETQKVEIFEIISRILIFPCAFYPFILPAVIIKCKRKGVGRPLSIEAMRESKKSLPERIYKFCSLSTDKTDKLNQKKITTLKNNEIFLSRCTDLNDPFEGQNFVLDEEDLKNYGFTQAEKESFDINTVDDLKKLFSKHREMYMQTSFTLTSTDMLMWGHYANSYKGYCLEYIVDDRKFLFPVSYLRKRPILTGISSNKRLNKKIGKSLHQIHKSLSQASAKEFTQYMLYLQSFKSTDWAYEKEVRLIDIVSAWKDSLSEKATICGLKLSKIIVGFQSVYTAELKEIAKLLNVKISVMQPNYTSNVYKLIEKEINLDKN